MRPTNMALGGVVDFEDNPHGTLDDHTGKELASTLVSTSTRANALATSSRNVT